MRKVCPLHGGPKGNRKAIGGKERRFLIDLDLGGGSPQGGLFKHRGPTTQEQEGDNQKEMGNWPPPLIFLKPPGPNKIIR